MTRKFAPARIASAGVVTRLWSSREAPAGRTPGVRMTKPESSTAHLMGEISSGEATTPSKPDASQSFARLTTSSSNFRSMPTSFKESWVWLVRTVTPKIIGRAILSCSAVSVTAWSRGVVDDEVTNAGRARPSGSRHRGARPPSAGRSHPRPRGRGGLRSPSCRGRPTAARWRQ